MTATKTAMTASALAFALLFGGGVYVMMNLSSLAKPVTERIASAALGVPVKIDKMDIQLQEKTASVSGVRVANPAGFSDTPAITIEGVSVTLDTLAEKLITFKSIDVNGTKVNLEVTEDGTNLGALQKGMPKKKEATSTQEEQLKVIIKRFSLNKAWLNPSITLLGKQDLTPVAVPPITLTGIGQKENGILAEEAIAQVTEHLVKVVSEAANNAGFYQGMSPEALKELGLSQVETLKNQVSEEINKLGDGLKKLFE